MEHACRIALIGGGPAGVMTAALLNRDFDITIFDYKPLLTTLLPTGGGKCNITNAEPDFRVFASNYPRGEKFLYSVLSRFSSADTIDYFEKIGVKTVILDNGRVFPEKMDAGFVRSKLLEQIRHCKVEKARVVDISGSFGNFRVKTEKAEYLFDKVVVTTGGHGDFGIFKKLGINIIPSKPALTGLCTEKSYNGINGLVLKNVINLETGLSGDVLFTHFGISGPLVFKISSLKAREQFPYALRFDLTGGMVFDSYSFQEILNSNSKKELKNILSEYLPKNFVIMLLAELKVDSGIRCCEVNGKVRDLVIKTLKEYKIIITKPRTDGEIVMSGGVDLKYVNSKTLEYKNISGLYFAGEVLDIDGFCGGFNLQNCWSGAYIVAQTINAGC